MWQNIKFYAIALGIIFLGALISTGLQLLEAMFPEIHPLHTLAANLSGVTLGGAIMVIGFIRDGRLEDERKRTEAARAEAKSAQAEVKSARNETKAALETARSAQEEAKLQRQRADEAEAELQRLLAQERANQDANSIIERLRRLEEINGVAPPEPGQ